MTESMNFSTEALGTGFEKIGAMIAETMEHLASILDRSIDAVGEFAAGVAQKVKKLAQEFKAYFFADKEIIIHKQIYHLMKDLNKGLAIGDQQLQQESHRLYGMVQEVKDYLDARLLDASYREHFSFLYVEDIKPEMSQIVDKLYVN